MKLTIFYSWQTSTDTKYNKNFIQNSIEKAIAKLKKSQDLQGVNFELQDGVRGEPGSPAVASKITDERIPDCDLFIADLSVINQTNAFLKLISRKFGSPFKPFQNNNVIAEYGVALNAIGKDRIIGVLNKEYGSPKDNPENVPFDIRHLRFPIEFEYSKKKEKAVSQKPFVDDLAAAIRDTALFALRHQKNKYIPLVKWDDWEKNSLTDQKFIASKKSSEIESLIIDGAKKPRESIRLLGLSGLGKTRILLETFRPSSGQEDSILFSSRVLYMNCNLHPNTDYQALFTKLFSENEGHIIILDNCPLAIHRQALNFIKKEDNSILLVSLESNPEEIQQDKMNGVNYLVLKKEELTNVVDDILERDFSQIGKENIERIKEFSQGIPLMAVLLAESIKGGEKIIGKLDDKELLDKLLGAKGKDEKNRTILKACSIFNYFGYEDEVIAQIDFIAKNKNITSLNGDDQVIVNDFNEVCNYYLKREIFERKGRFIGMRPFPLAMYLAQEWLEPCTPQRLLDVITDIASLIEPHRGQLSNALSEQMKFLGYSDKAVDIVDKIIGPDSPFDNAEVLNTDLGSRLFRSFVEVNPIAVSDNFYRNFYHKSSTELLAVIEGRRNIIWVLEKICFDKRTFLQSARILYSFAVAENETWANNATGQLLHLFKVILPGTEASLVDRWEIIEWGLQQNTDAYVSLALKAMDNGLGYGHFSRAGGAEMQGTRQLVDFNPTWEQVDEYWDKILKRLTQFIKDGNNANEASLIIAENIRSFFRISRSHVILPYLREIIAVKNQVWDEGQRGLKTTLKYEGKLMADEIKEELSQLIESLTKTDFFSRYIAISNSYYLEFDYTQSEEKTIERLNSLAEEFVEKKISWEEALPLFYKNPQPYSFSFGKKLYEIFSNNLELIYRFVSQSLLQIRSLPKEERNISVLIGFISNAPNEIKQKVYSEIKDSDELNYLLFQVIPFDPNSDGLEFLFQLVDSQKVSILEFYNLSYKPILKNLRLDELVKFSERLMSYGDQGYEVSFDLLFDLGYNDESLKSGFMPMLKKSIYKIGVKKHSRGNLDTFKWSQTINQILSDSNEKEFAVFINDSIIETIDWQRSFVLDYEVQQIYELLMKHHFDAVWPKISEALLYTEDQYIIFYGLKNILGSHIGGVGRTIGVLFDGNLEKIFEWCKRNIALAPARLAELVPIFDNGNSDFSKWHPIAIRLINEYGELENVRRNIDANMGTFSWTGSVVPFLISKKELFQVLLIHPKLLVKEWAAENIKYLEKEIQQETIRDAETFL